jgi:hypothetical protein
MVGGKKTRRVISSLQQRSRVRLHFEPCRTPDPISACTSLAPSADALRPAAYFLESPLVELPLYLGLGFFSGLVACMFKWFMTRSRDAFQVRDAAGRRCCCCRCDCWRRTCVDLLCAYSRLFAPDQANLLQLQELFGGRLCGTHGPAAARLFDKCHHQRTCDKLPLSSLIWRWCDAHLILYQSGQAKGVQVDGIGAGLGQASHRRRHHGLGGRVVSTDPLLWLRHTRQVRKLSQ